MLGHVLNSALKSNLSGVIPPGNDILCVVDLIISSLFSRPAKWILKRYKIFLLKTIKCDSPDFNGLINSLIWDTDHIRW